MNPALTLGRSSKGQHSAPRGGPPRSWTNDDLTKALENVWNKRMTTSQASRVFGIPYNSLLMYVRGKYGKSLRLDVLKKNTPAANDNLNTIGNSRSTPKEKGLKRESGESGLKREDWLKERGGGSGGGSGRKSSHQQQQHHHDGPGGPMSALFNFDPAALGGGPFGGGMLHFPPMGEPLGLLGLGMPAAGRRSSFLSSPAHFLLETFLCFFLIVLLGDAFQNLCTSNSLKSNVHMQKHHENEKATAHKKGFALSSNTLHCCPQAR
jgi:hypothetical protein